MTITNTVSASQSISISISSDTDSISVSLADSGSGITNILGNPVIYSSAGAQSRYQHNQSVASDTWTINHNFGYYPDTEVFSVGGKKMLAEVLNISVNQVQVFFDAQVAGFAVCS